MLNVEAIDLYYDAAQTLRAASLRATRGRGTGVLGRNGVEKSSLLRAITGLQPIRGGRITWQDQDISRPPPTPAPGAASPTCRRAERSSPCSRCART